MYPEILFYLMIEMLGVCIDFVVLSLTFGCCIEGDVCSLDLTVLSRGTKHLLLTRPFGYDQREATVSL